MKPVKTLSSNHNFGPPIGVTDGSIGDLPCEMLDEQGRRYVRSIWKPSDEEREWLASGKLIELDVAWIGAFPPISLNVTNEAAVGDPDVRLSGAALIAAERRRQLEEEGWSPEHDDTHEDGELAIAAACYAIPDDGDLTEPVRFPTRSIVDGERIPPLWPWEGRDYKRTPHDRERELVKAGALIAAEIDRLRRLEPSAEDTAA